MIENIKEWGKSSIKAGEQEPRDRFTKWRTGGDNMAARVMQPLHITCQIATNTPHPVQHVVICKTTLFLSNTKTEKYSKWTEGDTDMNSHLHFRSRQTQRLTLCTQGRGTMWTQTLYAFYSLYLFVSHLMISFFLGSKVIRGNEVFQLCQSLKNCMKFNYLMPKWLTSIEYKLIKLFFLKKKVTKYTHNY